MGNPYTGSMAYRPNACATFLEAGGDASTPSSTSSRSIQERRARFTRETTSSPVSSTSRFRMSFISRTRTAETFSDSHEARESSPHSSMIASALFPIGVRAGSNASIRRMAGSIPFP